MRLVICLTASIGVIISGSALLAIWWTKQTTKRRWQRSRHILIVNEEEFNEKKQILYRSGPSSLQVIMDFDYTMTQYYTPSGHVSTSTHGVFSRSGLLPQSFIQREAYLFEKYFQYETDPTLSPTDRYKYMEEWWRQAHSNLIDHKTTKSMLQQCMEPQKATILLRQGCREVIDLLEAHDIPLLIFSAGIGDVIEEFFRRENMQPSNFHILSNRMIMDENGVVTGFQEPVVHPSNKALLVDRAAHVLHPDRAAFIVVGDHIHDALMCDSIPYAEVHLKVGLLNTDIEARLNHFKEVYDVIIIDDGPLDFLSDLVNEIIMN